MRVYICVLCFAGWTPSETRVRQPRIPCECCGRASNNDDALWSYCVDELIEAINRRTAKHGSTTKLTAFLLKKATESAS